MKKIALLEESDVLQEGEEEEEEARGIGNETYLILGDDEPLTLEEELLFIRQRMMGTHCYIRFKKY